MRTRTVLCLALAALLAVPAAAPAPAPEADQAVLAPLQVALRDLPGIIAHALNESERRLLSDEAQAALAQELQYVRGFSALPPAEGALREADVRAAYAWIEAVVETVSGIPSTFDDSQRAGASCRASFAGVPLEDPKGTVTLGFDAVDRLDVLRTALQALLAEAPAILEVTPLAQAVGQIDGYATTVAPGIVDCLEGIDTSAPRIPLKAVVLPSTSFPTGRVRVVGTAPAGSAIHVASPGLGLDAAPALVRGSFRQPVAVPREAQLGNHTIRVSAGDLNATLTLRVAKAPVQLRLDAPARVLSNASFPATVSLASPASVPDLDRVPVTLLWRGRSQAVPLANASASVRLPAGDAGRFVLSARFPGNAILAAADAEVGVTVSDEVPPVPASSGGLAAPHGLGLDWFWWTLVLAAAVAFGLALYMSPVALHRLRTPKSAVVRGSRPPPRWPGAATFAAAIGALFEALRRLGAVPPGRTVHEWIRETRGPMGLADQFDAVRYGGAAESEQTTAQGVAWTKKAWEWWTKR